MIAFYLFISWKKKRNPITQDVYVLDEESGLRKVAVRRLGKVKCTSTNINILKDQNMSSDRLPKRNHNSDGKYHRFSEDSR